MAALFDTTVAVLLLRRTRPSDAAGLIKAARAEIEAGTAVLPAPAATELMVGERGSSSLTVLAARLSALPTAVLTTEAAAFAGSMGAFLMARGRPIPLPDLLIAGTAVWLDIPLLAWDSDYARSRKVAERWGGEHPGAELWRALMLHPSTLGG